MIKLACGLTYDDLGKKLSVVTTAWLLSPLPDTFDESAHKLVFGKPLSSEQLASPAYRISRYTGKIRNITFKSNGTVNVILGTPSQTVKLMPSHEIEVI